MAGGISEATGQNIITIIGTLLGTGVGAFLSYVFSIKRREQDRIDENIINGNKALFALFRQINTLALIKIDIYDEYENDIEFRFIAAKPLAYNIDPLIAVDCERLSFFMQSSAGHRQLIFDLSIINDKYRTLALLINKRNELRRQVNDKLEMAGLREGTQLSALDIKGILGPTLTAELKDITEKTYELFPRYLDDLEIAKNNLRNGLSEIFPTANFINFKRL